MRPVLQQRVLTGLAAEPLDLLIIGGGIVGAGVARDAALRGVRTGLIDRHDFAFGTSSRSSRLLHGGIRYLAQGRLGLVRESSVEKMILHRIAPHLVEPLAFIFPAYRDSGRPLWQLRVGVKLYDWLSGGRNLGRSRAFDRREIRELLPGLKSDGLTGAVRYYDALTNDARLVIDTLRAADQGGALLANYVRFEGAERRGDFFNCQLVDEVAGQSFTIETRCVVNAAGPWSPGFPLSRIRLRLTKGTHLVFERERLPVSDAVVITEGSRLLFVIPWGGRTIVGTTDTDFSGPIEAVRSEPADVEYLLRAVNELFPATRLGTADVVSSWAGLRPLIADPKGRPSDISRSHRIVQTAPGWWDVAGGKLTTFRLMAEQTVDQVVGEFGRRFARCRTAEMPLLPAEALSGLSRITPPEFSRELVAHYCAHEWALHLDDVMMRRSGWHFYHRGAFDLARQASIWMAELQEWSDTRRDQELARYQCASDWPITNAPAVRGSLHA